MLCGVRCFLFVFFDLCCTFNGGGVLGIFRAWVSVCAVCARVHSCDCGAQMVPSIQSTKRARWTATYISFCEQIAREAINRGVWAQVTLFKGSLKAF